MKSTKELAIFESQMQKHTVNFPRPSKQKISEGMKLDPVIFAVITARIHGIINEMVESVIRTARNPILNSGKDLTCSILTYDGFLLTMANSLPIHLGCLDSSLWGVMKAYQDDIHPGDAFVNSSPYHGNNHVGDFTMHAPIFHDGELVAWASTLCHLIDVGAYVPLSIDPLAVDVFAEGIHFPPLRLCKDYQEIPDIIRFIEANFRYPDQWHGDFLAQIGSIWTGQRRVVELCRKYGNAVIKQFQDEYLDYGDRRMTEEITKLPKGEWVFEALTEKVEPMCPNGALMKVTMSIDPDAAMIYFDLTDMPNNIPWGYNTSYATTRTICIQGSLPSLDSSLPRNDGVLRHFKVYMREGAMIGMPRWPVGTSLATMGIADEATAMVLNLWEQVRPGAGHASGGEISADMNFSGIDFRRHNQPFGHSSQLVHSGGGASKGCDGWPNFKMNGSMGNMYAEGVEIFELKVPLMVKELRVRTDSGGAGQWRGGTGQLCKIEPRCTTTKILAKGTGFTFAPLGVAGGKPGALAEHWVEKESTGEKMQYLTGTSRYDLKPDEIWVGLSNGGGGYGDPLERDPEAVRDDARNYLVSLTAARNEYGVLINPKAELYEVDYERTKELRTDMKQKRG